MSKSKLLAAALIVVLSSAAQAQTSRFTAGANLMGIASRGEFHNQIDQAFGLGGNVVYQLDDKGTFAVRLDANWLNHGWDEGIVDVRSPLGGNRSVELMTSNDIFFLEVGPEVSWSVGKVRPYVGARAGLAYFVTEISATRSEQNLAIATNVEQHDAVFAYAAQAGVRIPIVSALRMSLDLGAEYQRSDEALFLQKGSIDVDSDGRMLLAPSRGKANFWGFHMGVSMPVRSKKR